MKKMFMRKVMAKFFGDANGMLSIYSRVHISSDTAFLKILKKPSIVQE